MTNRSEFKLPQGAATGVGSLPGGDAREAARVAVEATEAFPFLPELPARGPGADMIGRTIGMLVELYARVEPSGWRFGDRPGRETKRARAWLGEDLDALEEFTQGYEGPLKVQAVGPWTLAAAVELRNGEAALRDPGACRDLAASLAEGVRAHLADVGRRVPGADVVLQLDEPSLTDVLTARVRTASGYRTYRSVDRVVVESTLRELIEAAGVPVVVHSCAPDVPFALLRRAARPGSPSTSRCSPSVTGTPSGRPPRAAPRSSPVSCRAPTQHCRTLPVASVVFGRCGAGWDWHRGRWGPPWPSPRPAVWRGPHRPTPVPRWRTARKRHARSSTTLSDGPSDV